MINKNYSLFCRGILAIIVVLHHFLQLYDVTDIPILNLITLSGGYLSVSGFLFLSGYSTRFIFNNNKFNKISHLLKRILGVYIPFAICNSIYIIIMAIFDKPVLWKEAILSYSLYILIVPSFWFVAFIIWNFLISFVSFKFSKYKIVFSAGCILFLIIALLRHLDYYWIYSNFSFLVGIIWKDFEKTKTFSKFNNNLILITCFVFSLVFALIGQLNIYNTSIYIIPKMIASIFIVFFIGLLSLKSNRIFSNKLELFKKFIRYIGQMSLEIYLIHVMIIKVIVTLNKEALPNFAIIGILLFVGSFIFSTILYKADHLFMIKLKNILFNGGN